MQQDPSDSSLSNSSLSNSQLYQMIKLDIQSFLQQSKISQHSQLNYLPLQHDSTTSNNKSLSYSDLQSLQSKFSQNISLQEMYNLIKSNQNIQMDFSLLVQNRSVGNIRSKIKRIFREENMSKQSASHQDVSKSQIYKTQISNVDQFNENPQESFIVDLEIADDKTECKFEQLYKTTQLNGIKTRQYSIRFTNKIFYNRLIKALNRFTQIVQKKGSQIAEKLPDRRRKIKLKNPSQKHQQNPDKYNVILAIQLIENWNQQQKHKQRIILDQIKYKFQKYVYQSIELTYLQNNYPFIYQIFFMDLKINQGIMNNQYIIDLKVIQNILYGYYYTHDQIHPNFAVTNFDGQSNGNEKIKGQLIVFANRFKDKINNQQLFGSMSKLFQNFVGKKQSNNNFKQQIEKNLFIITDKKQQNKNKFQFDSDNSDDDQIQEKNSFESQQLQFVSDIVQELYDIRQKNKGQLIQKIQNIYYLCVNNLKNLVESFPKIKQQQLAGLGVIQADLDKGPYYGGHFTNVIFNYLGVILINTNLIWSEMLYVNADGCLIQDKHLQVIMEILKKRILPNLRKVDLSNNLITQFKQQYLKDLVQYTRLNKLILTDNPLSQKSLEILKEYNRPQHRLIHIDFQETNKSLEQKKKAIIQTQGQKYYFKL